MLTRIIVVILLLASFSRTACAQSDYESGYIITLQGDSLAGFIAVEPKRGDPAVCYFRETLRSDPVPHTPESIRVFGIQKGKRYESLQLPSGNGASGKVFVRAILVSFMSLYQYKGTFYIKTTDVVEIPKRDGRTGNTFVEILNNHLRDCSLSASETDYREKDIVPLIISYNRCKKASLANYATPGAETPIHFVVYGGGNIANISINGFTKGDLSNASSATGGVGMEIRIGKTSSLNVDFFLISQTFSLHTEQVGDFFDIERDYKLDTRFLKVPIGIQLNLLSTKNSPYIKGGFVQYFSLESSWTERSMTTNHSTGVIAKNQTTTALTEKNQAGFWLGAGYSVKISRDFRLLGEVRAERCKGLGTIADQDALISNFTFLLGVRF